MANFRTLPDSSTTPIVAAMCRWIPLGYAQATVTNAAQSLAALGVAIPTDASMVQIIPEVAIRFRDDGVAPTAATGVPLVALQWYDYSVVDFTQIQFIAQAGGGKINFNFYK